MSEKYTIARLTKDKAHFEILVKPQNALSYRNGKLSAISTVLVTDQVFSDANKGKKASEEQMRTAFETIDPLKIADIILKKGTLQLTTEQRRKMVDDKRKQIRYLIDPYKPVEEQARDIIKLLRPILPLKIEQISVSVTIPVQYAARAYGSIKNFGELRSEEWRADGSWCGIIELSAGAYSSFLNKLGNITKGNGETKIIK